MTDKLGEDLKSLRIDRSKKRGGTRRRRWLTLSLLFFFAVIIGLTVAFLPDRAGFPSLGAAAQEVEVAMVVRQTASSEGVVLTAGGYIIPRRRVEVSSKITGRVEQILVEKGDVVQAGQVLARLDDVEIRAQLAQASANKQAAQARFDEMVAGSRPQEIDRAAAAVEEAEARHRTSEVNLERAKRLFADGVYPQQQLDDAQNTFDVAAAQVKVARENLELARLGPRKEQVDLARAQLAEAEASVRWWETQLDNTIIRAPVPGTILERIVEKGEMVTTGFVSGRGAKSAFVSIANLSELEVELDINESDIPKIYLGQRCVVSSDSYPDRKYEARVREIAPEANRQKATILVKVAVENPDKYLRPETNAKVNFFEEKGPDDAESRILIPSACVSDMAGSPSVFVLKDGRAVRQQIGIGKSLSGQVEVTSGLAGGERVIVRGYEGLADGARVKLKQP